jgi:serine/threonine-protein kinase
VCPTCRTSYPDAFFCGADGSITLEEQDPKGADPRIGLQLGGYIVVARVADGAMGRVYEGRHPETKARVAIKVLHANIARDRVAVERFKREFETAREMNHPNIVKVLEFGATSDGSWFMTMEYLQGRELAKAQAGKKPLPRPAIVRVMSQIALALDHAHSFGFIHRDLKPDNIFLCDTPAGVEVRLLDFGSVKLQMETGAKLTALGTTLGSPYYMSPEQALGAADVDQRSDVFALGAILWEMITGRVAFEAVTVAAILMKILHDTPAPASSMDRESPVAVDDVVDKAIRKDKKSRYDSARRFAESLITAYGLGGTIETWASKPEDEIAHALTHAVPPAPKPFGASLVPGAIAPVSAPSPVAPPPTAARPASGPQRPPAGAPMATAAVGGGAMSSSLRPAGIDGRGKRTLGIAVGLAVLVLVMLVALLR